LDAPLGDRVPEGYAASAAQPRLHRTTAGR
jgi:hypothetical protein